MLALQTHSQLCEPRYRTARDPARRSLGPRLGVIAAEIGHPLMPWQQMVADVGLEMVEGPSGWIPAYREIIVTVSRQSGKTTLVLAWELDRVMSWGPRERVVYTAQTGQEARKKLIEDHFPIIEGSPFAGLTVKKTESAADTQMVFARGCRLVAQASSDSSGHGGTNGLGVVDEFWHDSDDRREQAILPTMLTRPDAQILYPSTAGTERSVLYNRKRAQGRASVLAGADTGVAYFEWSADEDDKTLDPDDPEVWRDCMPALGYTIDEAAVRHARSTMTDGEFRRAMLNIPTVSDERVIPEAVWKMNVVVSGPPSAPLVLAIDAPPNRDSASLVIADEEGRAELVDNRPGASWVVERATEVAQRHNASIVVDERGPLADKVADLKAAGLTVHEYSTTDVVRACGSFYDAVGDGKLRVVNHDLFDVALAAALRAPVGDAWKWSRKSEAADISPLVALTLATDAAARGLAGGTGDTSEPFVIFT